MSLELNTAPIHHVIDDVYLDSLPADLRLGLNSACLLGEKLAQEWIAEVELDILHEAATRHTTNQQIAQFIEYRLDRLAEGEDPLDGNLEIIPPTDRESECSPEILRFFRNARDQHFIFAMENPADEQFLAGNGVPTEGIPNQYFRAFEDGAIAAIRRYYLSLF